MRAVVYDRYGPPEVLRLEDVPQPVPKEDEVLIKIHATTVTRSDCGIREANASSGPFVSFLSRLYSGVRRPKRRILGAELAGEVAAVGATVSEFAVGDRVFGTSAGRFGAHAEFICMRERAALAQKPAAMTFEEAAAVCDPAAIHEEGRPLPQGADRGREIPSGHRPDLPAGGCDRCDSLRRDGAQDRERRPDNQPRRLTLRARPMNQKPVNSTIAATLSALGPLLSGNRTRRYPKDEIPTDLDLWFSDLFSGLRCVWLDLQRRIG